MVRNTVVFAAAVLGFGAVSALSALPAAAAGEHCQDGAYCLYSGTNYTGSGAVVQTGNGCHAVSTLGFPVARSAARGFGDGYALQLFADTSCTTSLGYVYSDVPDTNASAYRVIPIPG